MLQISNLAVLLVHFFLLFSFLVFTKSQVLNVRMGRSRKMPITMSVNTNNHYCIITTALTLKEAKNWQLD